MWLNLVRVFDHRGQGIPFIDSPVRKGISPLHTFGFGLIRQSPRVPPDSSSRPRLGNINEEIFRDGIRPNLGGTKSESADTFCITIFRLIVKNICSLFQNSQCRFCYDCQKFILHNYFAQILQISAVDVYYFIN
ncbi:hypothetical protein BpHYR1_023958 [Brachionus plicatilis]|uniref:Uncharacterized protein n=1 Tax=Brachionus plicatilis TaxID=10195 RepID=A0A3M7SPJ8_BRAPC|nr:hypothetical protein BpHYR1_023958 [Brachionus plicatilis]